MTTIEASATRHCTKCLRELPFQDFSPHPLGRHGLRANCKPCRARDARERYRAIKAAALRQKEGA